VKHKLELLRQRAIDLIKNPKITDGTVLARLGPVPAKIQQLETQLAEIESETTRIENFLDDFSSSPERVSPRISHQFEKENFNFSNGRREQKKIRIEINLSQIGASSGRRTISEHKASDSLVRFLELLYETKGVGVLEKLTQFSVNRGVLVSKNPKTDYCYRSNLGEAEYQYQPISNSGFYVLTQSATKEKVADIKKAWSFLGFPTNALTVEEADKYETSN
jgi:hypothetical protein